MDRVQISVTSQSDPPVRLSALSGASDGSEGALGPPPSGPQVRCRFCLLEIPDGARVCHHCRVPQALWHVDRFGAGTLAALLLSLLMATLSVSNTILAQQKEAKAENAVRLASEALARAMEAEVLARELDTLKQQVRAFAAETFGENCLALGGIFDAAGGECVLRGGRTIRFKSPF
jgi:hypothetical protein